MKRILYSILTVELMVVGAVWSLDISEAWAEETPVSASSDASVHAGPTDLAAVYPQGHVPNDPFAELDEPWQPNPFAIAAQRRRSESVTQVPRVITVYEDVEESSAGSALRQQYLGVMRKHARRMTEEELKSTIENLEAEMKEQDAAADAEVQKAIAILEAVVEKSQGTPAAVRSRLAIDVLKNELPQPAGVIQQN